MNRHDGATSSGTDTGRNRKRLPFGRRRPQRGTRLGQVVRSSWAWLVRTYATVDPRSLGLCRILLGLLLFADVARRYRDLDAYYTNIGWLTNHFSLYRPMSSKVFSIYHAFSTPEEVRVLFFAHCLVNLLFLIGYRTRLMHTLSLVLWTSINSRNIIIENGGFVMLTLLTLWTWFLPMGQRFSIDAWLRAWRSRREQRLEDLNDRSRPAPLVAPVVSLGVTAVILQWAVNYYLNTVQKTGVTWHDGTAIYYFVQQARLLHPFGVWLRDQIPLGGLEWLTHATLVVEGALAFLWVSPLFPKAARMLAWLLGIGLHFGILAFATLGPFVWVMLIPYAMFIPREVWEWGALKLGTRRQRLAVFLDEKSPVALGIGRILKRLDPLELLRFVPATVERAQSRLAVAALGRQAGQGPMQTGKSAARQLFRVLPLPGLLCRLLSAIGGARLLAWLTRQLLRQDGLWERRLGLHGPAPAELQPASAAGRQWRKLGRVLAEFGVVFLVVVSTSQVLLENRAVPEWMKPKDRPEWMTSLILYPRLFQGWSMFAPDPPREDGWVVVDGRTVDGRKVDPLTGKPPNFSLDLPYGPDFSAQWEAFHMRIFENRYQPYYGGFQDYLTNQHLLTGRPQDRLRAFDVWYVSRIIYPPGKGFSHPNYRKLFSFGEVKDSGVPDPRHKAGAARQVAGGGGPRSAAQSAAPSQLTSSGPAGLAPRALSSAVRRQVEVRDTPPARAGQLPLERHPGEGRGSGD